MSKEVDSTVTPANAGVQEESKRRNWIPAFAGMTAYSGAMVSNQ